MRTICALFLSGLRTFPASRHICQRTLQIFIRKIFLLGPDPRANPTTEAAAVRIGHALPSQYRADAINEIPAGDVLRLAIAFAVCPSFELDIGVLAAETRRLFTHNPKPDHERLFTPRLYWIGSQDPV